MRAKLFIEVRARGDSEGTIAETSTVVVPRIGEVICINEAKNSKCFDEVVVTDVSYKALYDETEVWLKAEPVGD